MKQVRSGWLTRYRRDDFKVPSATLCILAAYMAGIIPTGSARPAASIFDVRLMPGMTLSSVRDEPWAALAPVMDEHRVTFALTSLFVKGVAPFAGQKESRFVQRLSS